MWITRFVFYKIRYYLHTMNPTIITIARQLISNYNHLLAATVNMPDTDRVYYARRIQEGIDRAEEMIAREVEADRMEKIKSALGLNVGDNSLLHY
jgi:hypothetical protein